MFKDHYFATPFFLEKKGEANFFLKKGGTESAMHGLQERGKCANQNRKITHMFKKKWFYAATKGQRNDKFYSFTLKDLFFLIVVVVFFRGGA